MKQWKLPKWAKWVLGVLAGLGILRLLRNLLIYGLVLLVAMSGQSMTGDWSYELPNDYAIWRINSRRIVVGIEKGSSLDAVLDRYICAFCYNGDYIGLQCVDVPEDLKEEIDTSNPDYYLIDMGSRTVGGPMTLEAYQKAVQAIADMTDWISTVPAPAGAEF